MTLLNLILHPNPVLYTKSEEISEITPDIKQLAYDMLETMYHHKGIGLAANQVGILKRIIVVDLQENEEKNPKILVNPKILQSSSENEETLEGCLSLPSIEHKIIRPADIEVQYQDLDNKIHKIHADRLLSVCIQHEIDHLNGLLFIDHLSSLKKTLLLNKYKKHLKELKNK